MSIAGYSAGVQVEDERWRVDLIGFWRTRCICGRWRMGRLRGRN
nr:MAG TPA: hypothetical protein [Caudoviricetes sp.]